MSSTSRLDRETYLPEEGHRDVLAHIDAVLGTVSSPAAGGAPLYLLFGPGTDDRVELPAEVYSVLHHVVDAMSRGLAVTVTPKSMTLTTQQAADLLGVSRPTFIRYLDAGYVPFERVGVHRRVRLAEVLAYRDRRRAAQYAALEASSGDVHEDDVEVALEELRAARHRLATERRTARSRG